MGNVKTNSLMLVDTVVMGIIKKAQQKKNGLWLVCSKQQMGLLFSVYVSISTEWRSDV